MSETAETKPAPKEPKRGGLGVVLGLVLPALLAAGAAFGGVKVATKNLHAPAPAASEHQPHRELKPPGPTIALDPFLVSMPDANKKPHPVKMTLAIEFDATTKEDALKPFMPRIRDAFLAHVRGMTLEDALDPHGNEKMRADLLEKCHRVGAFSAERVLITDLVSQ